jgi:hypothetical protein
VAENAAGAQITVARNNASSMKAEVNRAPVPTLWAAIVAEQLGFDRDEALTMGRVVAELNAYSKGKSLGIFKPAPEEIRRKRKRLREGKQMHVERLRRAVPIVRTPEGLRAVSKDKHVAPESVQRYLEGKFGEARPAVVAAMQTLAQTLSRNELAERAYALYEIYWW